MKKQMVIIGAVLIALVGGWELVGFIARLPVEMPDFLDDAIRWSLKIAGAARLENTDDFETIAFLLAFCGCVAFVGMVEASLWLLMRRVRLR